MKNFVVYTALFGAYDKLNEPKELYPGCEFVCFTDQANLQSKKWKVIHVDLGKNTLPNVANRMYKFFPHQHFPNYQSSLYVDSNIQILSNPYDLKLKYLSKYNLCMPKHFVRNCIYEEAKECIILKKESSKIIQSQMCEYKNEGMPKNFGLGENGILLRNHNNQEVIRIMGLWWEQLQKFSKRDQLSLGFVLWKSGLRFDYIAESARNNNFFKYHQHSLDDRESLILKKLKGIDYRLRRAWFNNTLFF